MNDTQIITKMPSTVLKEKSFILDNNPILDILFPCQENIIIIITCARVFVLSRKTKKILKIISNSDKENNFCGSVVRKKSKETSSNMILLAKKYGVLQFLQLNSGKIMSE